MKRFKVSICSGTSFSGSRGTKLGVAKIFTSASVMALVLAACGSSANSSSSSSSSSVTKTSTSGKSAPASLKTITFSEVEADAGKLPLYAAIANGFFAKQGLKVDISTSNSTTVGIQQVVSGAIDIAETADTSAIEAKAKGGSVEFIAGEDNVAPYTINAAPSIKSVSDLVGKKVGTGPDPANISTLYFNAALKGHSVNPSSVTPIYSNTTGDRFSALTSGAVSAALLTPPFTFKAAAAGFPILVHDIGKYSNLPFTAFVASPAWTSAHSSEVQSFMKAYLEGIAWVYNSANKTAAINILSKYTKSSLSAAADSYNFFVSIKTYPKNGEITGLGALIKVMNSTGVIKTAIPSSSVENMSYVKKAYSALKG